MTEQQIKIADDLLKYLAANNGTANLDQWPEHMEGLGHGFQELGRVEQILVDMRLVRKSANNYHIALLEPEGSRAAGMGVAQYLANKEQAARPQPSVTIGNQFMGDATHVTTGPVVQGSSISGQNAIATTTMASPQAKSSSVKTIAIRIVASVLGAAVITVIKYAITGKFWW